MENFMFLTLYKTIATSQSMSLKNHIYLFIVYICSCYGIILWTIMKKKVNYGSSKDYNKVDQTNSNICLLKINYINWKCWYTFDFLFNLKVYWYV